jgi:hypothetical protein
MESILRRPPAPKHCLARGVSRGVRVLQCEIRLSVKGTPDVLTETQNHGETTEADAPAFLRASAPQRENRGFCRENPECSRGGAETRRDPRISCSCLLPCLCVFLRGPGLGLQYDDHSRKDAKPRRQLIQRPFFAASRLCESTVFWSGKTPVLPQRHGATGQPLKQTLRHSSAPPRENRGFCRENPECSRGDKETRRDPSDKLFLPSPLPLCLSERFGPRPAVR